MAEEEPEGAWLLRLTDMRKTKWIKIYFQLELISHFLSIYSNLIWNFNLTILYNYFMSWESGQVFDFFNYTVYILSLCWVFELRGG